MPWYRVGPPGRDTIVHVRVPKCQASPRCLAPAFARDNHKLGSRCHRSAVALCDATASLSTYGRSRTCDMPICELHRTIGDADVDYCPRHQHWSKRCQTTDRAPSNESKPH